MSVIDKAVAALTPAPSQKERDEARARARSVSQAGDWLSMILDHHVKLDQAFADAKGSAEPQALKQLGALITGHAIAEEAVIYPAMTLAGEEHDADHAYKEQVMVKKEMAALEQLPPSSDEFQQKLEQIRVAVVHHMIEEEGDWFAALRENGEVDQTMLTKRYAEEFERYTGMGERSAMNL